MTDDPQIDLQEIINEMGELGRALFNEALERVQKRKVVEQNELLRARIAELESQRAGDPPNGAAPRALVDREKLRRRADAEIMKQNGELDG